MTWQRILVDGRLLLRYVLAQQQLTPFLFDKQRGTCEACAHSFQRHSTAGGIELLCREGGGARGCSFLRLPDQACGPDATRFTPTNPEESHGL